jgi:hypothetical protein
LFELMEEELVYLSDLPDSVWAKCATLIGDGTDPQEVRDSCLLAAHVGAAYLWDDSFE